MTTKTAEKEVLFYTGVGCDEENRKVLELLCKENIPYIFVGPKSIEWFPHIEFGLYYRYEGLEAITRFVERWKQGIIPPLEIPLTNRGETK